MRVAASSGNPWSVASSGLWVFVRPSGVAASLLSTLQGPLGEHYGLLGEQGELIRELRARLVSASRWTDRLAG